MPETQREPSREAGTCPQVPPEICAEAAVRCEPPTSRVSLAGRDLSFLDLSGLEFRAAELAGGGADLTGAKLTNADLSNAVLDSAPDRGDRLLRCRPDGGPHPSAS